MRIALIADVHSNLPALEAVLHAIQKHAPDRIISLGDQINLGPCPRETLQLLHAEGVECLHGNHERYILSAMNNNRGFEGANFAAVRHQAALFQRDEITFPKTIEMDEITLCHAMPDDDRFPVFEYDLALPRLLQMQFDKPTHIICGHGHNPTHIALPNFTLDSLGSVGCMDDGLPGAAPYAILTKEKGHTFLRPFYVQYDTSCMRDLFIRSGFAEICPIMSHINCLQMTTNQCFLVEFVTLAELIRKEQREPMITDSIWQEADRLFTWPDGVSTAEFWKTSSGT